MSEPAAPGWMLDRLRANLRVAGIPLRESDLERILEAGMLRNALAFEALEGDVPLESVPDHLGPWTESVARDPAPEPAGSAHAPASGGGVPPAPGARPAPSAAPRSAPPAARSPAGASPGALPAGSIAELAARIRAREISPVELIGGALARIAARDPEINAFQLVLDGPARAEARAAEREIAAGRWRGPLHGLPVAVKDLLALAGTPTTAGSPTLGKRVAKRDATAVARLRAAGAVIVGKTRLPEFAYSPGSNNPHFGPTHNPHDLSRDAGGSSSGSGAAVADGMAIAALGSDTGGSIRIPAALCGIVGCKPTFGRVSLAGAVPLAWSLDHLGPMTRAVADAALLLQALAGRDAEDSRTRPVPVPDYAQGMDSGVAGLRVGVLGEDGEREPLAGPEPRAAWQSGLQALERAGAILVPVDLPVLARLRILAGALIAMEAAAHHAPRLRERAADYGEFVRLRLLSAHAYRPGAYLRAQQARGSCRREFERAWAALDLLCTPAMPAAAPPLGALAPTRFTAPFNVLGWPALCVPAGRTSEGLPLGLQLVGRPWDEATLLRAAWVVEGAGRWPGPTT